MKKNRFLVFWTFFLLFSAILVFSVFAVDPRIIVKVDIPENYEKISPGDSLIINSEVILLREDPNKIADVVLEYFIYDEKGSLVIKLVETKGLQLRLNTLKEIKLPPDTIEGTYTLDVKASYGKITTTSSDLFEIKRATQKIDNMYIIIAVILILFITALFYEYKKFKYIEKMIKKIDERDLIKRGFVIKKVRE